MRARTSARQACGSTALSLAGSIRVQAKAAVCPPPSEPANSQCLRPTAKPRIARPAALMSTSGGLGEVDLKQRRARQGLVHPLGGVRLGGDLLRLDAQPRGEIIEHRAGFDLPNASSAWGMTILPSAGEGQTKRPFSSRLANRHAP